MPGRYFGAHDRTRTGDLLLTKEVLYLLSYMGQNPVWTTEIRTENTAHGDLERETGLEPATFSLEG